MAAIKKEDLQEILNYFSPDKKMGSDGRKIEIFEGEKGPEGLKLTFLHADGKGFKVDANSNVDLGALASKLNDELDKTDLGSVLKVKMVNDRTRALRITLNTDIDKVKAIVSSNDGELQRIFKRDLKEIFKEFVQEKGTEYQDTSEELDKAISDADQEVKDTYIVSGKKIENTAKSGTIENLAAELKKSATPGTIDSLIKEAKESTDRMKRYEDERESENKKASKYKPHEATHKNAREKAAKNIDKWVNEQKQVNTKRDEIITNIAAVDASYVSFSTAASEILKKSEEETKTKQSQIRDYRETPGGSAKLDELEATDKTLKKTLKDLDERFAEIRDAFNNGINDKTVSGNKADDFFKDYAKENFPQKLKDLTKALEKRAELAQEIEEGLEQTKNLHNKIAEAEKGLVIIENPRNDQNPLQLVYQDKYGKNKTLDLDLERSTAKIGGRDKFLEKDGQKYDLYKFSAKLEQKDLDYLKKAFDVDINSSGLAINQTTGEIFAYRQNGLEAEIPDLKKPVGLNYNGFKDAEKAIESGVAVKIKLSRDQDTGIGKEFIKLTEKTKERQAEVEKARKGFSIIEDENADVPLQLAYKDKKGIKAQVFDLALVRLTDGPDDTPVDLKDGDQKYKLYQFDPELSSREFNELRKALDIRKRDVAGLAINEETGEIFAYKEDPTNGIELIEKTKPVGLKYNDVEEVNEAIEQKKVGRINQANDLRTGIGVRFVTLINNEQKKVQDFEKGFAFVEDPGADKPVSLAYRDKYSGEIRTLDLALQQEVYGRDDEPAILKDKDTSQTYKLYKFDPDLSRAERQQLQNALGVSSRSIGLAINEETGEVISYQQDRDGNPSLLNRNRPVGKSYEYEDDVETAYKRKKTGKIEETTLADGVGREFLKLIEQKNKDITKAREGYTILESEGAEVPLRLAYQSKHGNDIKTFDLALDRDRDFNNDPLDLELNGKTYTLYKFDNLHPDVADHKSAFAIPANHTGLAIDSETGEIFSYKTDPGRAPELQNITNPVGIKYEHEQEVSIAIKQGNAGKVEEHTTAPKGIGTGFVDLIGRENEKITDARKGFSIIESEGAEVPLKLAYQGKYGDKLRTFDLALDRDLDFHDKPKDLVQGDNTYKLYKFDDSNPADLAALKTAFGVPANATGLAIDARTGETFSYSTDAADISTIPNPTNPVGIKYNNENEVSTAIKTKKTGKIEENADPTAGIGTGFVDLIGRENEKITEARKGFSIIESEGAEVPLKLAYQGKYGDKLRTFDLALDRDLDFHNKPKDLVQGDNTYKLYKFDEDNPDLAALKTAFGVPANATGLAIDARTGETFSYSTDAADISTIPNPTNPVGIKYNNENEVSTAIQQKTSGKIEKNNDATKGVGTGFINLIDRERTRIDDAKKGFAIVETPGADKPLQLAFKDKKGKIKTFDLELEQELDVDNNPATFTENNRTYKIFKLDPTLPAADQTALRAALDIPNTTPPALGLAIDERTGEIFAYNENAAGRPQIISINDPVGLGYNSIDAASKDLDKNEIGKMYLEDTMVVAPAGGMPVNAGVGAGFNNLIKLKAATDKSYAEHLEDQKKIHDFIPPWQLKQRYDIDHQESYKGVGDTSNIKPTADLASVLNDGMDLSKARLLFGPNNRGRNRIGRDGNRNDVYLTRKQDEALTEFMNTKIDIDELVRKKEIDFLMENYTSIDYPAVNANGNPTGTMLSVTGANDAARRTAFETFYDTVIVDGTAPIQREVFEEYISPMDRREIRSQAEFEAMHNNKIAAAGKQVYDQAINAGWFIIGNPSSGAQQNVMGRDSGDPHNKTAEYAGVKVGDVSQVIPFMTRQNVLARFWENAGEKTTKFVDEKIRNREYNNSRENVLEAIVQNPQAAAAIFTAVIDSHQRHGNVASSEIIRQGLADNEGLRNLRDAKQNEFFNNEMERSIFSNGQNGEKASRHQAGWRTVKKIATVTAPATLPILVKLGVAGTVGLPALAIATAIAVATTYVVGAFIRNTMYNSAVNESMRRAENAWDSFSEELVNQSTTALTRAGFISPENQRNDAITDKYGISDEAKNKRPGKREYQIARAGDNITENELKLLKDNDHLKDYLADVQHAYTLGGAGAVVQNDDRSASRLVTWGDLENAIKDNYSLGYGQGNNDVERREHVMKNNAVEKSSHQRAESLFELNKMQGRTPTQAERGAGTTSYTAEEEKRATERRTERVI